MKEIRIVELFAGVGGFRVGLERADSEFFRTIWSNQYEPAAKSQEAYEIYNSHFLDSANINKDIALVKTSDIPECDMLVGGFPCQDYSVATSLVNSKGIEGKKGVLWWQIYRILDEMKKKPPILFLENVDRLLLSPASQRGRDFAIILGCLDKLGYFVEWRVINAAEYGMPQKRRRTYIIGLKKNSGLGKAVKDSADWIAKDGIFAKAFPIAEPLTDISEFKLTEDSETPVQDISENFNKNNHRRPFGNSGVLKNGVVQTAHSEPDFDGKSMTLRDVLATGDDRKYVTEGFFVPDSQLNRWKYLKGSKREARTNKSGFQYFYTEGAMDFPDSLDKPSRTMITSEGASGPDRCRHIILDEPTGRYRRLIPLELERLDMFPSHWTNPEITGVRATDSKRGFLMGNALVCGIVEKVGIELANRLKAE